VTERGRHAASYYRNTVIHFMLVRAIAELAARAAAEDADPLRDTRSWALRLRELLKFEFFFAERDGFLRELEREQQRLSKEASQYTAKLLAACPRVLLDFIESYWVVAETVRTLRGSETAVARAVVLRRCHELGRQLLLQDRVQSPELLSNMNFGNALKLLENLGAAERDGERYRAGPAAKLDELVRDLERLIALARSGEPEPGLERAPSAAARGGARKPRSGAQRGAADRSQRRGGGTGDGSPPSSYRPRLRPP
jgi:glycerol-3-phosphate O-acyltransferase